MKKCKVIVLLIMIVCIMMTTTACSALDGVLTFGEEAFDSIFGFVDKGPLGKFYDWLNIEGLITGEHGGNFENPDDNPDDGTQTTVKVESIAVDYSGAKTVFKFAEKFNFEGLKVTATMSDGTTKDIPLTDIQVKEPDTTTPGVRVVMVTYEGKSARYEVTINEREIPAISGDALVNIEKENENAPYRVEAELIDMAISGVVKADGVESFVATAPEGTELISGNKYLTGYGVKWNYFGFTFTAAQEYKDVTIVLRVANPNAKDIDASVVKAMLNYDVELPLEGYIIAANGGWSDIIIRNITIPQGTNTLTFDVLENNAFDIDYVDLYVGARYINSVVEITDSNTVIRDLESLDTEKAFTRSDVAELNGLKDGQLFVEPVKKEWPGGLPTSGGTSVGAVGKGSLISTTLRLSEDATVRILFKASKTTKENSIYYVDDHWNFYIDGVKLQFVEYVDIHGGDRAQAMYWEWKYTNLGEINLSAGDHSFVIEAVGTDCNVDTIEFEIISFGSYDEIGKDLSEQKHTCNDICPVCGKCTTKCDDDACAEKCQGCKIGHDVVINGDGSFIFEAEDFDITNLTPSDGWEDRGVQIETPTTTNPPTSGGKSLGACGGGYTTILIKVEERSIVQIYGRLALRVGGEASKLMAATLGDTELVLIGNVPAGVSDNPYFNWADIPFGGAMELEPGEYTLTITFLGKPNVDCIKFEVTSYGAEHKHTEQTVPGYAATCESNGLTDGKICTACGETVVAQEEIPALGHDTVTDEAVAPTCTTIGKTEGSHCTRCDGATVAQEEIPALGHDIVIDKAVEATCTTPGKTEGSHCSRCDGATVAQQEIPAGHKNENGDYICDSCGANLCTEHNIVTDKAVAATCTATGLSEGSHCSTCNTILVAQEEIPALGHDIVIDKAVEATCTTPGKTEGSHCSRCDGATVAQEDTALKPHTYTAEYTLEGVKTYYAVGETFDTYALVAKLDCAKCDHVEVVTDYTVSNTAPLKVDDTSVTISWIRNEVEYSEEITIYVFDVDAVILGGTTNVEAENLPLNYLNKQTAEGVKIESFNVNDISGKSIGNLKGGYQIFTVVSDKDVTVQLAVSFAKKQGGKILSYIPAISVNGQYLTLTDGDVPVGVSGNQYFNFAELGLATIELKAGVKYEFCVNLKSGNLDKYILKVVDGDGQQVPDKYTDVTVSSNGTSKFEFETINPDKCDINTRADFISAGQCAAGDVGRGNGTIYGFNNGSIFRVYVNVTEAGLYKISIAGKGNVAKGANINLSAYSWKFGDTVITPAASAKIPDGSIGEAVIGTVEITEPGIYVFEFTFGIQTDLDYLAFEMHEHSEQILSSVAPTCTATGLTEGKICSSCGMVFVAQETVDALGHNIVTDAAVEPTCTTDGKTEGSHCTRCDGATVAQDVIPAAHKDENGDYICDSCGSNLCTEHNIVTDKAVAATCTTPGKTEGSHCSNCNMVLVAQNEVPALGHSYDLIVEGVKTVYLVGESFDTANLVAKLDCMACDHIEEVSDYALSVSGALKNSDESVTVSCVRNGLTYSENIAIMVVDARISGSDVSIEAETLLTNLLTPDSTAGVKIESFNVGGNSGKSLGGLKGGYQIFTVVSDNDVTVQLNVMFAKKAGGKILSYIPAISVNGQYLTLTNGDVPAGVSGNQYFNFGELGLAKIELKAGVKYEFCVNLKSGNLDKYILKVVDGEGQQVPDKYTDVTVATSGVTKYQLENINPDKCDINTRADFVSARQCAAGDVGRGNGTIYGFDNGSVFRVYVNVTEACTLNIGIAGKGNVAKGAKINLSAYSWQFGDTVITPAEGAAIPDGTIGEAAVGTVEITEAGIYVFEFTFGIQTDLDYVSFEVVD